MACLNPLDELIREHLLNRTSDIPFTPCEDEKTVTFLSRGHIRTSIPHRSLFSMVVLGCISSLFLFIGVTANLGAASNVRNLRNRLPLHNYLISLFLWDVALLIVSWLLYCVPTLAIHTGVRNSMPTGAMPYLYLASHVCLMGVIYMNLATCLERYLVVRRPTRGASVRSGRFWLAALFVLIFSVTYNIPRFFEINIVSCCSVYHIIAVDIPQDPITMAQEAPFAKPGTPYYITYKVAARTILVTVGPVLGTSALTFSTLRSVVGTANSGSESYKNLIRITTFMISKFSLCHGFCAISDIVELMASPFRTAWVPFFDILRVVTIFLIMLNSAADGILYMKQKSHHGNWESSINTYHLVRRRDPDLEHGRHHHSEPGNVLNCEIMVDCRSSPNVAHTSL